MAVTDPSEQITEPSRSPGSQIEIKLEAAGLVNFAMQQNDVPLLSRLSLTNKGTEPIEDILVRLTVTGGLAGPAEVRVGRIDPGATFHPPAPHLRISHAALAERTEREVAELQAEASRGGEVLAEAKHSVEVLAHNEWGGGRTLPEILAAFVTPNDPALAPLLSEAATTLRERTGEPGLTGYQCRDPRRVRAMIAALYEVVASRRIAYITPPASFESDGQKVRAAETVLAHRLGTCLDLALLLASLIEQAGLHAMLLLVEGHAFVGAWTIEESFPEAVVEDALRIRKRAELGEIVVVEAAGVTADPPLLFDAAAAAAERRLADEATFRYAVDVRAARRMRIRPLPLRNGTPAAEDGAATPHDAVEPPAAVRLSVGPPTVPYREPAAPPTPAEARLDRWKRKLLDLSLRNRLINFRETKQTVRLECPDVPALEDALASGVQIDILPRTRMMEFGDPRDPRAAVVRDGATAREAYLRDELRDRRVHADLQEGELSRRLLEIFRSARTSLDESGANMLYLAVGSLVWYEAPAAEQPRRAPLLLVPVALDRRSAREGFRMVRTDEDPQVNVTLLEKLRSEFGMDTRELADLPEDDNGLNVAEVFVRFRRLVMSVDCWHVEEDAWLGLFSFAKFLMWADLEERSEDLLRSRVVRYLVDRPSEPFSDEEFPDPAALDSQTATGELLCPLDADSSQLVAVHAGAAGRSFVLEGPPGTGKSQTITNLIAQALAQGKRVLFVAEKMAALDVVHRRLRRAGLSPFCLELHSNKAAKKQVLAQIMESFEAFGAAEPKDWPGAAERVDEAKRPLNEYVRELHGERTTGRSFYETAAAALRMRDAPVVPLRIERPSEIDEPRLVALRAAIESLAIAGSSVHPIPGHPLREIGRGAWESRLPDLAREVIDDSDRKAAACLEHLRPFVAIFAPESGVAAEATRDVLRWLADAAEQLLLAPPIPAVLLTEPGWSSLKDSLGSWIARGRRRDELRSRLSERYHPALLALDLDGLAAALRRAAGKPMVLRWLASRAPRRELASVLASDQLPGTPELIADLDHAIRLKNEHAALCGADCEPSRYFGRAWKSGEPDWAALEGTLAWVDRFRRHLAAAPSQERASTLHEAAVGWARNAADALAAGSPAAAAFQRFVQAWKDLDAALAAAGRTLAFGPEEIWAGEGDHLSRVRGTLARWRAGLSELREWCAWRRARAAAPEELLPLVLAFEAGNLEPSRLADAFERAFAEQWLDAVSDATPMLRDFSSDAQIAAIGRFRESDRRAIEVGRQVLRARLAADVPPPSGAAVETSEVGLLQRQARLQRRHMPVRKLIQKLPNLLPRLKPCFLMSPLSVAQYLDPSVPPFDLVIFDEASQVPVWDAVGAAARGREVVVVGDSRQLPPTTFFQKLDSEEPPLDEDFEELESILDECNASGLPALRLLWHYRSRHESLIAFSNFHYYENRLETFPAPVERSGRIGVSLRRIPEGRYDKGGARTNPREAEAVVEEIVARLTAPGDPHGRGSIGVVTFSLAQQILIEDLLDQKRREHPSIEPYFTDGDEPLFVKNLENVQGDERDTILFSVCYGPDERARVAMNFGPLNRDGGERRLNVAITRARTQVIVFTSLHADQIDLSRTRAVGVRHLKSFLEYAERGPAAIGEACATPTAPASVALEEEIARELASRGWRTVVRLGCAGYRIGVAVEDPDRPGEYILGIEGDGDLYRSAHTARDRDRLREQVLQGLGWRLHRVWIIDWRTNRGKAIERIERAIEAARGARRAGNTDRSPDGPSNAAASREVDGAAPGLNREESVTPGASPYVPWKPRRAGDTAAFYQPASDRAVAAALEAIVEQEGPIVLSLATRRLASAWDIERVTTRVEARIAEILAISDRAGGARFIDGVLWPAAPDPDAFRGFRSPTDDPASEREIDEIPVYEMANAMAAVLAAHVAMPSADLARETIRLFGFQRTTPKAMAAADAALELLERQRRCERNGATIALPS